MGGGEAGGGGEEEGLGAVRAQSPNNTMRTCDSEQ